MAENYDYGYLVVEGIWRPSVDGQVEVSQGNGWASRGASYRSVDNYLATLELKAGMIVRRTSSPRETVAVIVNLYRYWRDKTWDEHKAHEAVYAPGGDGRGGRKISFIPRKVSLLEKLACQLPGIDSKAREVAKHFQTADRMMRASEADWQKIDGIGKLGAKKIVEALAGGK
jgi:ERCC4-type nuclease